MGGHPRGEDRPRIYHAGAETPGNWWFWEIGAPRPLLWTCLLVGDALPVADRADYVAAVRYIIPDPRRHKLQNNIPSVGANRSDLCEIAILDGMLDETEDRIAAIVGNTAHRVDITGLDVRGDQVRLSITRPSAATTNVARVFEVEVYPADSAGYPVVTTVENRNLHATGANALTVDGRRQPSSPEWTAELAGARWAHLDGVGGYVFPGGATLRATREERTAAWRDIDSGTAPGTTDPVTRRYVTLSVEHGVEPRDAEYAYLLLPGASARHTARVAADPGVDVVANSSTVQAIRTRDQVMAAFFGPGSAAGITVDAPVAVIVARAGRTFTVSVADPTRAQTPVHITIDRATTSVLRHDPELAVTTGSTTTLTAALSGTTGGTRSASFLTR